MCEKNVQEVYFHVRHRLFYILIVCLSFPFTFLPFVYFLHSKFKDLEFLPSTSCFRRSALVFSHQIFVSRNFSTRLVFRSSTFTFKASAASLKPVVSLQLFYNCLHRLNFARNRLDLAQTWSEVRDQLLDYLS